MKPSGGDEATTAPSRLSGRVSKGLSVIAVALAAAAIALSAVLPGPVGPAGATGPPGPPGSGSILATGSNADPTPILYVCTAYANVTISVPGPGTVVVSASVRFAANHTMGQESRILVAVDLAPGRCTNDAYLAWWSSGPRSPSQMYNESLAVQKPLRVLVAATYTYYVSGYVFPGEDGDLFLAASLVAVYYPA